jgi:hypothetical protein
MSTTPKAVLPKLSFWQIWNMCFGFFGIQFGWSLQMGNMSAIYEYLGATPEQIAKMNVNSKKNMIFIMLNCPFLFIFC